MAMVKESVEGGIASLPFPPTAQASYGPTEKATEYGLETLPRGINPLVKSPKGTVELRFIAADAVSQHLQLNQGEGHIDL